MIPAPDLDVTVRTRRLVCVLDSALLLASPHGLLLAQQMARSLDLWVCPAFWRLLDASEFFARRPARLREWLSLEAERPAQAVAAAITCWSRWRASRDLASLGLYWVGDHQTESFLPEHGPRDVPARFEALVQPWLRDIDAQAPDADEPPAEDEAAAQPPPLATAVRLRLDEDDDDVVAAVTEQVCIASSRRCDSALEAASLSVALQAPVLTLTALRDGEPPALVGQWAEGGLPVLAWAAAHPGCAAIERERWWQAMAASGIASTVAAAACAGVRLGLAQVVAPTQHCDAEGGAGDPWSNGADDDWQREAIASPLAGAARAESTGWWRDALALWMPL